jgi:hypothetical protein
MKIWIPLLLFPHVMHAESLRKEDNIDRLLLEKIEKLEGMVRDLQSQVSEQQRRLSTLDCFPEFSVDGNQCVFARNVTFTALAGFEGPTSFHNSAEFNDDVKFEDLVLFADNSAVDFLGKATFDGTHYDPDDDDAEFAVEFRTQSVFKEEVLFEGDTEFEHSVLFLQDLTIEGPGARRSRRRLKKDDDDDSKKDEKGATAFEIVGKVYVDVDSDEDVVLSSETWCEDDLHVEEYDDKRGRMKDDKKKNKKKNHNLIVSGELDIQSDLVVEGLVDMKDDAVVHGIIVYETDECLVACDGVFDHHGLC